MIESPANAPQNAIEFKNVTKRFGQFVANKELNFKIREGSIHGLIGENGAGKSTAMKVLFGLHQPDEGEILIFGKPSSIKSPVHAMGLGIGMVHQHFMLAPTETVLDNIILGQEPKKWGIWIDRKKAQAELNEISKRYGLKFSQWQMKVSELSVGEQQRVEILKLLYQKSEVLILDEPTAVLTPQEVKELFENLRRLKEEGKTIVLISHKLKEVLEYTDTVTVMRRGAVVGDFETKAVTEDQLAEAMVGRKVSFTYSGPRPIATGQERQRALVSVRGLSLDSTLKNVNFELRPGEVLGIGGVQGNGQSELLRFLSDPQPFKHRAKGEYEIRGRSVRHATPLDLRNLGLGLVPEDRHEEGLLLNQDMNENFLLGQHRDARYLNSAIPHVLGQWIDRKKVHQKVEAKIKEFDIRPTYSTVWAGKMSGGNQQKLLIARALDPDPSLFLVAHPTRGVDVGAIERIHEVIMKERNRGKGVLLFSTELDELTDLSDRILIFFEGHVQAEFARNEFDPWVMGRVMGGGHK